MKGTTRQMVRIRTPESRYFKEVYFVLKQQAEEEESALLREAKRILQSADGMEEEARRMCTEIAPRVSAVKKERGRDMRLCGYLLSALLSGVISAALTLCLMLLSF